VTTRQELNREVPDGQEEFEDRAPGNRNALAPREATPLLNLREIEEMWGAGEDRVYRLVAREEIPVYGRPGGRKYYPQDRFELAWGKPTFPPRPLAPWRHKQQLGERTKGG
jgi:hypothetical protein